jgi:hypothetical protein
MQLCGRRDVHEPQRYYNRTTDSSAQFRNAARDGVPVTIQRYYWTKIASTVC